MPDPTSVASVRAGQVYVYEPYGTQYQVLCVFGAWAWVLITSLGSLEPKTYRVSFLTQPKMRLKYDLEARMSDVYSGDSVGRHFGPMHGERSRRHQMVVAGSERDGIEKIIVSVYELPDREHPRQAVELTHGLGAGVYARADLTIDEATALRDWLDEFVRAYA